MVRIDRIEHGGENRIAAVEPSPGQQEHRPARRNQRDPYVNASRYAPGKNSAQQRSKSPRGRRIKHKSRLTIGEVRQSRPAWINNAMLPLRENLKPRIEMKLQIVPRRNPKEEEGNFDSESRGRDRKQRRPEQRGLASRHFEPLPERMLHRACLSQIVPPLKPYNARKPGTAHSLNMAEIIMQWSSATLLEFTWE